MCFLLFAYDRENEIMVSLSFVLCISLYSIRQGVCGGDVRGHVAFPLSYNGNRKIVEHCTTGPDSPSPCVSTRVFFSVWDTFEDKAPV